MRLSGWLLDRVIANRRPAAEGLTKSQSRGPCLYQREGTEPSDHWWRDPWDAREWSGGGGWGSQRIRAALGRYGLTDAPWALGLTLEWLEALGETDGRIAYALQCARESEGRRLARVERRARNRLAWRVAAQQCKAAMQERGQRARGRQG